MRTSEAGLYEPGWAHYGYHTMKGRGSGVENLPGVGIVPERAWVKNPEAALLLILYCFNAMGGRCNQVLDMRYDFFFFYIPVFRVH